MPTMTIEVQETKKALEGKKRGRIIDASGITFQADKTILGNVTLGSKYDVTYNDETFKTPDGRDLKYRVITELNEVGKDSMTTVTSSPSSIPASKPSQIYSSTKDEDISVLAIMKSQQIKGGDREAIFHCLKQSALAWRDFKKWQKTLASDMDDEIPG